MGRGRKKIVIDWKKVDNMLAIHCTGEEIAAVLDITYETLCNAIKREFGINFLDYSAIKRGVGKASLRRRQFKSAEDGNVTMMIWLGKQWLGQDDKIAIPPAPDSSVSINIDNNVSIDVISRVIDERIEKYK